jgi:CRP-like cAMP-binding protein
MAVTPEQANEAWTLFKDTPLWDKWPEIQTELVSRLSIRSVRAGNPVYRPGDPADYLYLISNGTVLQTIRHEGQVWFQRSLTRGQFFGQHSLFSGRHHTGAVATSDTDLFLLTAADLRMALEHNPDLREYLLREKIAARLRSIPLFEGIAGDDMGWLALLMEDRILPPGSPLGLKGEPGLWVIDWGQVAVNGPAAFSRPAWRLTAGNFVLSPGALPGAKAIAGEAATRLQTRLLYLAADHLQRLAATFPDLIRLAGRPLDIAGILEQTRPLQGSGMTTDHFRHLAQFCAWSFVPAGQNITTQGAVGYSFIAINRGAAVVSAVDNEGRLRPQNLVKDGNAFGLTSLLKSKRRDATVRAVASGSGVSRLGGTDILALDGAI